MSGTVVIGVGNPTRGDDGFGIAVARALRERDHGGVRILERPGEATALLDAWSEAERVIVVDAASSDSPPGTIHRFEAHERPLPVSLLQSSTHGFGVACAVELARALGVLPGRVVVYAVAGRTFDLGSSLSPEVEAALPEVVDRILTEVRCVETLQEA
jgi:hydrogenase maturation protease